jgi:Putative prokaryotic signal transducing protein
MKSTSDPTFVKVLETDSLSDIALIKSVLDAEGINYFIQGENAKFLQPMGPAILMVAIEDFDKTTEALKAIKLNYVWGNSGRQ